MVKFGDKWVGAEDLHQTLSPHLIESMLSDGSLLEKFDKDSDDLVYNLSEDAYNEVLDYFKESAYNRIDAMVKYHSQFGTSIMGSILEWALFYKKELSINFFTDIWLHKDKLGITIPETFDNWNALYDHVENLI